MDHDDRTGFGMATKELQMKKIQKDPEEPGRSD